MPEPARQVRKARMKSKTRRKVNAPRTTCSSCKSKKHSLVMYKCGYPGCVNYMCKKDVSVCDSCSIPTCNVHCGLRCDAESCQSNVCDLCIKKCEECGLLGCTACFPRSKCSEGGDKCDTYKICINCEPICSNCGEELTDCHECYQPCYNKACKFGPICSSKDCLLECGLCNNITCGECVEKCIGCDKEVCYECYNPSKGCDECEELSRCLSILLEHKKLSMSDMKMLYQLYRDKTRKITCKDPECKNPNATITGSSKCTKCSDAYCWLCVRENIGTKGQCIDCRYDDAIQQTKDPTLLLSTENSLLSK